MDILAELEVTEDPDDNVDNAIARIKKQIEVVQSRQQHPGMNSAP